MKTDNLPIEILLAFLVVFSPVFYGSVAIIPLSIVESAAFLAVFVFLFRPLLNGKISVVKIPFLPLGLFFAVILFQLAPVGRTLLRLLSKNTAFLYAEFAGGSGTSACLTICRESTVFCLLQLACYTAVFLTAVNYLDSEKRIKRLALLIIACGFAYSIYGLINRNLSAPQTEFSTFLNRDHFASYLEMSIFLCIGYAFINMHRPTRAILIFAASVMTIALFLTASRAGRVCFIASVIVFYSLVRMKRPSGKIVPVLAALAVFLMLFMAFIGVGPMMQRMEMLSDPLKAYQSRFEMLKDTWRIIKDFPVFGTGFGTFMDIAQKYKTAEIQVTYGFSHNEPAQLMAEVGFLGAGAFIVFLLLYIKSVLFAWKDRRSPLPAYLTAGCLAGMFSIILHSFFDFMFHIPANAILFFIILALAYRSAQYREEGHPLIMPKAEITISRKARVYMALALCILFLFAESMVIRRCWAAIIFRGIEKTKVIATGPAAALPEYKKLLRDIDRAISLSPSNGRYESGKADLLAGLVLRRDLMGRFSGLGFKNMDAVFVAAERSYRRAIDLNPANADYHLKLGWLYSITGELNLMKREFKKARLLDPMNAKLKKYIEEYINELRQ